MHLSGYHNYDIIGQMTIVESNVFKLISLMDMNTLEIQ